MSPKTYPVAPTSETHRGATARKFTGRGCCWMDGQITKVPATWEVTTKSTTGLTHMILCDYHFRQFANEVRVKVIE